MNILQTQYSDQHEPSVVGCDNHKETIVRETNEFQKPDNELKYCSFINSLDSSNKQEGNLGDKKNTMNDKFASRLSNEARLANETSAQKMCENGSRSRRRSVERKSIKLVKQSTTGSDETFTIVNQMLTKSREANDAHNQEEIIISRQLPSSDAAGETRSLVDVINKRLGCKQREIVINEDKIYHRPQTIIGASLKSISDNTNWLIWPRPTIAVVLSLVLLSLVIHQVPAYAANPTTTAGFVGNEQAYSTITNSGPNPSPYTNAAGYSTASHHAQQQASQLQSTAPTSHEPAVFRHNDLERTSEYWLKQGSLSLMQALKTQRITERAKNAILFIGDGMSLPTITASRILYGQIMNRSGEEEQLPFERLPNVALIKTYNLDQQIPDSAATATAILTGVKSNFYTIGVNGNVKLNDTNCQRIQQNQLVSLIQQAIDAGKSTGIVTNTRITHATPAAGYAHVSNRRWECDGHLPRGLEEPCKDIARQLIENDPGRRINVIMGGGRRCFFGPNFQDPGPIGQGGMRHDGRNLIDQWVQMRRASNDTNFAFVNRTRDLRSVDVDKTDYLLGLFSYSHMNYEELRDQSLDGEPSLDEMTQTAIKILSKNPKGYMLLVEGGRIDHAHHENVAGVALRETIALAWAIQEAQKLINERDTLLAVTADHAHTLTINGLAPRGNPILGLSRFRENSTQLPYTTLIYGNGPGHHGPIRRDPTVGPNSTDSPYYVQYAAIHQEEAFHDGSDVGIFASGPYAHLFQGVQEQSYIAHVFGYALCIGPYKDMGHCNNISNSHQQQSGNRQDPNQKSSYRPQTNAFGRAGHSGGANKLTVGILQLASTLITQLLLMATLMYHR